MKKLDYKILPPSVQEYLKFYLNVTKGRSELTVEEYYLDLKTFFRFIASDRADLSPSELDENFDLSFMDNGFIEKITTPDIYNFLNYCGTDRKNSSGTRARKVSALNGYFKYMCSKMKYIEDNPMDAVDLPKSKKALPKYLTLEQSIALLKSVEGKNKERDFCMLTLLLNCGLRVSELTGLNISSINFDENSMTVLGKGNKERKLYLNKSCVEAIKGYLKVRPHDGVIDRNALFISRSLKRIGNRSVQYMVEHYLEQIGLDGAGFSVHKLRHTAATLMYQHGNVDVLVLKEILGHENLATTEIYTHLFNKQLEDAMKKNPLSGE